MEETLALVRKQADIIFSPSNDEERAYAGVAAAVALSLLLLVIVGLVLGLT